MTTTLPALPSLEQLKRRAKDLVKQFKARDPEAARQVRLHLPRAAELTGDALFTGGLALSEAQLVLARAHGFPSWPKLKRHIEAAQPDGATALEAFKRAVQESDAGKVRALLRGNPSLREQIDAPLFSFDSQAIVRAASSGDRALLDVLLEFGADINARTRWWAGGFGVLPHSDPEFAAYLVERGATVDVWAAAGMNRLDRLEEIVREDPSAVNARGGDGQGPLHFAASIDAARLLLDHGADIDMRDIDHGGTAAQYMAAERPEICRYLLSRGAELDIFMAVQLGDLELVRRALEADPDALHARVGDGKFTVSGSEGGHIYLYKLRNGHSPLYLAAELGHNAVYEHLLALCTPSERLLAACIAGDAPLVESLLTEDPDIVRRLGTEQMRAIADAAWSHKTDAVRLMLKIGFDVDARGDHASTALNRAAVRGYADLIELLLAHGASLDAQNEFGGRPLGACLWGAENFRDRNGDYPASVEKLLAAGAPLSQVRFPTTSKPVNAVLRRHLDRLARTNIIAAIRLGRSAQTSRLLDADPGLANRPTSGMLPLFETVRANLPELARLLLDRGADPSLKETPDGPQLLEAADKGGAGEIAEMLRAHAAAPRTPAS